MAQQVQLPDNLRIVTPDDEEATRINPPKKQPLGSTKSQQPEVGKSIDVDPSVSHHEIEDKESAWGNGENKRSIPKGWVYLVALIFCAVVVQSVVMIYKAQQVEDNNIVLAEPETQEDKESKELSHLLQHAVESYLNATTLEEKARWVRHPARVAPLMRHHYQNNPFPKDRYHSIKSMKPITIWSKPFVALVARVQGNQTKFLVLEHSEKEGFKVDWETDAHYLPLAWKDFIHSDQENRSIDLRVRIQPDHHYVAQFHDESQLQCFRLASRDNGEAVFGYAKKGSSAWRDLQIFFAKRKKTHPEGEPVILRLTIPDGQTAKQGVIIEKFISDRWLYIERPSERARDLSSN